MSQQPIDNSLLDNVQGDILVGIPKKTELLCFFSIDINQTDKFRTSLGSLIPLITTGKGTQRDRTRIVAHKRARARGLVAIAEVNIAFSHTGVQKLGFNKADDDKIGDAVFDGGMQADIPTVADNINDWLPEFKADDGSTAATDGIFLIAGDNHENQNQMLADIKTLFGTTITDLFQITGDARPGAESGHEHFGFEDGVSQPAVEGFDTPLPGQLPCPPGVILLGRDGDTVTRPEWAKDGSFLCFRQLAQRVPEFDEFLTTHALTINDPSAPQDLGKELLGARMVGRWKSGAPVVLAALGDDPDLAADPQRNNDFTFAKDTDQSRCPFVSHIRKTNPRADLDSVENGLTPHHIMRRGIAFGPEVTQEEKDAKKTKLNRGLLFICYQSNLKNGFQFVQKAWSNTPGFIFGKDPEPGFDPITGQTGTNETRNTTGLDPSDTAKPLELGTGATQWVVNQGGEYYFSPSISGLKAFAGVTQVNGA